MTTLRIEGMKLQDQVHDNSKVADSNLVLKILSPNQRLNNPPLDAPLSLCTQPSGSIYHSLCNCLFLLFLAPNGKL